MHSNSFPIILKFKPVNAGLASSVEAAKAVGKLIAKKAIEKNVKKVVFDRAGKVYTGKVKALADEARAGGLVF